MGLSKCVFSLCSLLAMLFAEEVVLYNDGSKTVFYDTYIEEDVKGSYHEKSSLELELGTCELCRDKRIVFQCDITSIPEDALISAITLELFCLEDLLPTAAGGLLYITRKEPAISEVDWYQASNDEEWSKLGGDFGLTPIDTVVFNEDMEGQWVHFSLDQVIPDLRNWAEEKIGFLIAFDDVDQHLYASSEANDESLRPRLRVSLKEDAVLHPAQIQDVHRFSLQGHRLTISGNDFSLGTVSLYSLQGKLLERHLVKGGQASTIALKHHAAGMYIVELATEHLQQRKTVTLQGY